MRLKLDATKCNEVRCNEIIRNLRKSAPAEACVNELEVRSLPLITIAMCDALARGIGHIIRSHLRTRESLCLRGESCCPLLPAPRCFQPQWRSSRLRLRGFTTPSNYRQTA